MFYPERPHNNNLFLKREVPLGVVQPRRPQNTNSSRGRSQNPLRTFPDLHSRLARSTLADHIVLEILGSVRSHRALLHIRAYELPNRLLPSVLTQQLSPLGPPVSPGNLGHMKLSTANMMELSERTRFGKISAGFLGVA